MKSNDIDRKVSDVKDYNFYMFIELNRYFFSLLPFLLLLFLQCFFFISNFQTKGKDENGGCRGIISFFFS